MNLTDEDYRLFYAAFNDDVKTMQVMKSLGELRVDVYDYDGRTGLSIAASQGSLKAVDFLLKNGANHTHRDCRLNTALDDAKRENRENVAKFIEKFINEPRH